MKFKIGDKVVMVLPDQIISGEVVSDPHEDFGGIYYRVDFGFPNKNSIYEAALLPFDEAVYAIKNLAALQEENTRLQKEVIAWEERYYLCP